MYLFNCLDSDLIIKQGNIIVLDILMEDIFSPILVMTISFATRNSA